MFSLSLPFTPQQPPAAWVRCITLPDIPPPPTSPTLPPVSLSMLVLEHFLFLGFFSLAWRRMRFIFYVDEYLCDCDYENDDVLLYSSMYMIPLINMNGC
ncbi:hypothetical protein DL93DRAFT_1005557 [Clavulina sp. PMI_390]|nr:hypothetical protein DL93DRAFT_1005557 [Clavulina sp. PMI_390]